MLKHRLLTLCLASLITLGLSLALAADLVFNRLLSFSLTLQPIIGLSPELPADLVLINIADTNSAYDNYPRVLSVVERIGKEHEGTPTYILFNGNLFGRNNIVASRSEGEIDWAFLKALQAQAPVIFNIGARDFDFIAPEAFVREADAFGVTVISNINDSAGGKPIAPALKTLEVGEVQADIVGLARPLITIYREAVRPGLQLPDPLNWLESNYPLLTAPGRWSVLLSQAGLGPDRQMLEIVPRGTLVVGGNAQLVFRSGGGRGGKVYMHNGFNAERVNVTRVSFVRDSVFMEFDDYFIDDATPADGKLQLLVERVREDHLRPEDLRIVGTVNRDYSVEEAAHWAVESLREVSGADVAILNNDVFRAGLRSGLLLSYRFDEFFPFDSRVAIATVDGATLKTILAHANLTASSRVRQTRFSFIYASDISPHEGEFYTLVTSQLLANHASALLGEAAAGIDFEIMPETTVKSLLREALEPQIARLNK